MLSKGPIGLMVPLLAFIPDLIYRGNLKRAFRWPWLAGILVIALLLLPMLIGLYQPYGWQGIRFYFWTQRFGRITGENVWDNNPDTLFLGHTFLWSFMPWSFLALIMLFRKFFRLYSEIRIRSPHSEIITLAGFMLPFIALSFSHYQLPHYIYMLFPLISILTAAGIDRTIEKGTALIKYLVQIQFALSVFIWLVALVVNLYVFPNTGWLQWTIWLLLVLVAVYLWNRLKNPFSRLLMPASLAVISFMFLMMTHFYPELLKYQVDNEMVEMMESNNIPTNQVYPYRVGSTGYSLYSGTSTDIGYSDLIHSFPPAKTDTFKSFSVTMLNLKFLNPKTRQEALEKRYLVEVE